MAKRSTREKWKIVDVGCALISLENRPGVYVVIANKKAIYVGVSKKLRTRLFDHDMRPGYARNYLTPWGMFDDESFVVKCKFTRCIGDNLRLEARLIHRLRPIGNKIGKPMVKCA